MPHQSHLKKLRRPSGQRRSLFRGLIRSMLLHERIKTTEAKAKAIRPLVERMITLGRRAQQALADGDTLDNRAKALHYRRMALAVVPEDRVIRKLFDDLAPRYTDRPGGYTRILKVGYRMGDAAPLVLLEFV
jgi:large subunit ribosomal protein L17